MDAFTKDECKLLYPDLFLSALEVLGWDDN